MYQIQQQASAAIGFSLFLDIVMAVLVIWGLIWAWGATKRYEEREDAKLRALERIARSLAKDGDSTGRKEPDLTARW